MRSMLLLSNSLNSSNASSTLISILLTFLSIHAVYRTKIREWARNPDFFQTGRFSNCKKKPGFFPQIIFFVLYAAHIIPSIEFTTKSEHAA